MSALQLTTDDITYAYEHAQPGQREWFDEVDTITGVDDYAPIIDLLSAVFMWEGSITTTEGSQLGALVTTAFTADGFAGIKATLTVPEDTSPGGYAMLTTATVTLPDARLHEQPIDRLLLHAQHVVDALDRSLAEVRRGLTALHTAS